MSEYKELEGWPIGNPLTLLSYAFREGNVKECLEILTNIHFYLFRKAPTATLRRKWKKELELPAAEAPRRRFEMKIVKNRTRQSGVYFIDLTGHDECGLEYSNESLYMTLDLAPHSRIARRGFQLHGLRP